jgi:hypothetical protein
VEEEEEEEEALKKSLTSVIVTLPQSVLSIKTVVASLELTALSVLLWYFALSGV